MGKISQIEYNGTNYEICDASATNKIDTHVADTGIHVTAAEKEAWNHAHPYLADNTKYAVSNTVGGAANYAENMTITRIGDSITDLAAALPVDSERIYFGGSDAMYYGCPDTYCIVNIKKGNNHRTILDCYALNTGYHYINGCMHTGVDVPAWTGWKLQPNDATITELEESIPTKTSELENDSGYITGITNQELAEEEKEQARSNIDAFSTQGGFMFGDINMGGTHSIKGISEAVFVSEDFDTVGISGRIDPGDDDRNSTGSILTLTDKNSNGLMKVRIEGLCDPVDNDNAATKGYVDEVNNTKEDKPTEVTGMGDITIIVEDNTEYIYSNVASLTMSGAAVECHGFITFGSSPTISVSGFITSSGDDITSAASHEVWEFSCANGFIIWKNWGEFGE